MQKVTSILLDPLQIDLKLSTKTDNYISGHDPCSINHVAEYEYSNFLNIFKVGQALQKNECIQLPGYQNDCPIKVFDSKFY